MSIILLRIIMILLGLLLILTWIPWRDVFEKFFGNNALKAKIYVEAGEQVKLCKGRYYCDDKQGTLYKYKVFGVSSVVIVPEDYPYKYLMGSRMIRVIIGHTMASSWNADIKANKILTGSMLNDILDAHMGTEMARTIYGKALNIMSIVIIIGILIFAGYFIYRNVQPGGMFYQGENVPAQTQTVPNNTTNIPNNHPLE